MLRNLSPRAVASRLVVAGLCWLAWAFCPTGQVRSATPDTELDPLPEVLALHVAIGYALEHNPEIGAIRQQHGIAAAGIVIADTYPFNPVWEAKIRAAEGPESAGITNRVSNEHKVLIDVELFGQGKYRRDEAQATLARVNWEISFQEQALAVRVIRAFDGVLYREAKLKLIEETIQLNQQAAELVRKLVEQGARLRPADAIIAGTEVDDARSLRGPGRTALATARHELMRALGVVEGTLRLQGTLESPSVVPDGPALIARAMETRSDLRARYAALAEADARLKLTQANRWGNPNVGPAYEYDPTRISLIGAQFSLPLPVCNSHKGEILQREAERARMALEVRQVEATIEQDVRAALDRLAESRAAADYLKTTLPRLQEALKALEKLFAEADPGVDLLRVIDMRRKLLRARDAYLDAQLEVRQAHTDLVAAVGDPALVACPPGKGDDTPPGPKPDR